MCTNRQGQAQSSVHLSTDVYSHMNSCGRYARTLLVNPAAVSKQVIICEQDLVLVQTHIHQSFRSCTNVCSSANKLVFLCEQTLIRCTNSNHQLSTCEHTSTKCKQTFICGPTGGNSCVNKPLTACEKVPLNVNKPQSTLLACIDQLSSTSTSTSFPSAASTSTHIAHRLPSLRTPSLASKASSELLSLGPITVHTCYRGHNGSATSLVVNLFPKKLRNRVVPPSQRVARIRRRPRKSRSHAQNAVMRERRGTRQGTA
jgi:hypothetical protein